MNDKNKKKNILKSTSISAGSSNNLIRLETKKKYRTATQLKPVSLVFEPLTDLFLSI